MERARMNGRRFFWRAIQVALGVAVILLAVRSAARNWNAIGAQPVDWQVDVGLLLLSLAITWACYALLVEAWRRVVCASGERLGWLQAARIWTIASLGKYLPGKVWATAGAAIMARNAGVASTVAVTAALTLQGLALASGAVVVGLTMPAAIGGLGRAATVGTIAVALVAAFAMALLGSRRGVAAINRRLPAWAQLRAVPPGILAGAFVANAIAWVGYGVAFVVMTRGLLPRVAIGPAEAIGVFTASYLVGLVALFAPGGIGPREGVLVLLLTPLHGAKVAVALALASRVLLTVAELGAAVPFLLGVGARNRGAVPHEPLPPS